MEPSEMK